MKYEMYSDKNGSLYVDINDENSGCNLVYIDKASFVEGHKLHENLKANINKENTLYSNNLNNDCFILELFESLKKLEIQTKCLYRKKEGEENICVVEFNNKSLLVYFYKDKRIYIPTDATMFRCLLENFDRGDDYSKVFDGLVRSLGYDLLCNV